MPTVLQGAMLTVRSIIRVVGSGQSNTPEIWYSAFVNGALRMPDMPSLI
ncbi:hypothetical protein SAMN06265348_116105 [Pedobacter westerhofensis]|uniref:Uncharacterized protein n=1 Tax=Pedobacter westerhofensis TaxID=425512 RepID=A0A521FQD2_9SPHI|nr:hypothetical protein SAMN06265348_116105 [Pedobacter westerhofensis]